jgi:hypothetical protein
MMRCSRSWAARASGVLASICPVTIRPPLARPRYEKTGIIPSSQVPGSGYRVRGTWNSELGT